MKPLEKPTTGKEPLDADRLDPEEITDEQPMPPPPRAPAAGPVAHQRRPLRLGQPVLEAAPTVAVLVLLAAFLGPWGHPPSDFVAGPRLLGTPAVAAARSPLPVVVPAAPGPAATSEPAPTVPDPAAPSIPAPSPKAAIPAVPTPDVEAAKPAVPPPARAEGVGSRRRPVAQPEPAPEPSEAPTAHPAAPVEVTLTSRPLGEQVAVDGTVRGRTPLRVELTPGRHELRFGSDETGVTAVVDVVPGARNLWTYQPAEGTIR